MEVKVTRFRFGANGLTPLKENKELPINSRAFYNGYGMDKAPFAIISKADQHGNQKMVSMTGSRNVIHSIENYSSGISNLFGIGTYYDDIEPEFRYSEKLVQERIELAKQEALRVEDLKQKQREADRIELLALPSKFPHLKPILDGYDYTGIKRNLVLELKKAFPKQKFSIRKRGYDSISIYWTDGVTTKEVHSVVYKFVDSESDVTGDFRDYSPSLFNNVFGGFRYVFPERLMSEEIQGLKTVIAEKHEMPDIYESGRIIRRIWGKLSFPQGAANFTIENSHREFGEIEELYTIKYEGGTKC